MKDTNWLDAENIFFKRYPLTRERLLDLAEIHKAMNPKQFFAFLKRKGVKGKFDPKRWDEYMTAMTGMPGCRICGGIRGHVNGAYRCIEKPHHYAAVQSLIFAGSARTKAVEEAIEDKTEGIGAAKYAQFHGHSIEEVIDQVLLEMK